MTFEDLVFKPHYLGNGVQAKFTLRGKSVSVIRTVFSYGGPEGLYEIMVGDEVTGYLTPTQVTAILNKLETEGKL
jgi:hypothetical protein